MSEPILTVTVSNYNYGAYLPRALESVLAQSFEDFEVIVVDNASTDNSVEILRRFAEADPRIRVVARSQNQGALSSFLELCERARGRYRVQLDADDWVADRDAFALQVQMFEKHPDLALAFSPIVGYGPDGRALFDLRMYDRDTVEPGEVAICRILTRPGIAHTGTMMRMSAYRACGGYDARYTHPLDLKLWADLCAHGSVAYLNRPLYGFRIHDQSISQRAKLQKIRDETLDVIERTLTGPLAPRIKDPNRVRRAAIRHFLTAETSHYIFAGRYAEAWSVLLGSARRMPREALFQRQTLVLVARTVLGNRGFSALRNAKTLLRPGSNRRISPRSTPVG